MPESTPQPRPYQPRNASEAGAFQLKFCNQCIVRPICRILPAAMNHQVTDPQYPRQWQYDAFALPTCTSFRKKKANQQRHCKKTIDLFGE